MKTAATAAEKARLTTVFQAARRPVISINTMITL